MNEKLNQFTFAVLTYNQESTVIETLESIKYQIKEFGYGYEFKLYVTDDNSKDSTPELVKAWINQNRYLFIEHQMFCNDCNMGTVYNYNILMCCIGDEKFKVIAGDDLIGPTSIFKDLSDKDGFIDTYPFYKLLDGKIYYNKLYLYDYYYKATKYSAKYNLKWMRKGDFLHTPSTFYTKRLYEMGQCKITNSNFFLYEDDPSFYCMLRSNVNIFINFHLNALILYRYSLTATSTVPNHKFLKDWVNLQKMYFNESRGLEKIYFWFRKSEKIPRNLNPYRIIDRIKQIYRIFIVCCRYNKGFQKFYNNFVNELDSVQAYYNEMNESASDFCEKYVGGNERLCK